jgi:CotS family spore coat protein
MAMVGNNLAKMGVPEGLSDFGDDLIEFKRDNIYLIPGKDGIRVLKKLRIGAKQANIIGELLTYLNGSGLTPKLFRPQSGAAYFWRKGNRYFLTRFLPGRKADYYHLSDLQAAIRAMSVLHHLSRGFLLSHPTRRLFLKFEPVRIWRRRLREMELCRERAIRLQDPLSKEYLRLWYFFWTQGSKAVKELETIDGEDPEVICYHDWAFHNLIINNGKAVLIDFDYIIVDQPVHDRVNLISRYLRLHQWSNRALLKALWNFDRYYPWKVGELRKLRIYLTFPYEYWILGRQYFLERQPWSARYFQEQWKRKVCAFEQWEKILELIECFE